MDDLSIIENHGLPVLVASAVFVAMKYARSPVGQMVERMISPKLVMSAWPSWLQNLTVALGVGCSSFVTAVLQGQPYLNAATMALSGLLAMLNFGESTPKPVDSIVEPIPTVAPPAPKP